MLVAIEKQKHRALAWYLCFGWGYRKRAIAGLIELPGIKCPPRIQKVSFVHRVLFRHKAHHEGRSTEVPARLGSLSIWSGTTAASRYLRPYARKGDIRWRGSVVRGTLAEATLHRESGNQKVDRNHCGGGRIKAAKNISESLKDPFHIRKQSSTHGAQT